MKKIDKYLKRVAKLNDDRHKLRAGEIELVKDMYNDGFSFSYIAIVIGVTRQRAHQISKK